MSVCPVCEHDSSDPLPYENVIQRFKEARKRKIILTLSRCDPGGRMLAFKTSDGLSHPLRISDQCTNCDSKIIDKFLDELLERYPQ